MPTEFKPIDTGGVPLNPVSLEDGIQIILRRLTFEGHRVVARYPAKTGGRYRRTKDLARSWSSTVRRDGQNIVGRVSSNPAVAPYNVKVQGPRRGSSLKRSQVAFLRARGWRPVPDEMVGLWRRKYRGPLIQVIQRFR